MRFHPSILALTSAVAAVFWLTASESTAQNSPTLAPPEASPAASAPAPIPAIPPQSHAPLETKSAEETPFPMVVRIDKSALLRFTNSEIDRRSPVDKVVLETHAVGESRTRGAIRAELIPDSKEATFDIRFQGNTATKTVGTHEPALIYSSTFTNFDCTRRIDFDPRKGFVVVGETEVTGDTRLVYDGFGATRTIGKRMITRVAERRAGQSHEQARQIADRDNKREVFESFEREVAQHVREANEGTDLVRYITRFLGDQSTLQIFAKSSADCIHIGIGPDGEKYEPMTSLPPSREKSAPIELWVHTSILSESAAAAMKAASPAAALPLLMQTKILEALSLSAPTTATAPDQSIDVAFHDGWLILGFPDKQPAAKTPSPADDVVQQAP